MRLYEDEAKRLFRQYGIPTPVGESVSEEAEVAAAYERVTAAGGSQVVAKAQLPAGKRGKLGAIAFAASATETQLAFHRLRSVAFAGAHPERVLIEQRLAVVHEFYMAITVDDVRGHPVFLLSASGGMDVEEAAAFDPAAVHIQAFDPRYGLQGYHVRSASHALAIEQRWHHPIRSVADRLYRVFAETRALLVEINPLAGTADGRVIALDGKVILDDYLVPTATHEVIRQAAAQRAAGDASSEAQHLRHGVQYVHLGGDIGLISTGAGVGLQLVDWVDLLGGRAAGFVDLTPAFRDPSGPPGAIEHLLRIYENDPAMRVVLIAFAIGSRPVNALGDMAMACLERGICRKPVVFYFGGNSGEAARQRARERGHRVGATMEEAVRMAVELRARGDS